MTLPTSDELPGTRKSLSSPFHLNTDSGWHLIWVTVPIFFAKFQQKISENWMKKKMLSMLMMEGCWRDFCQGCWLNLVATQYSSWFDLKWFKFDQKHESQHFSLNILRRRKMKSDWVTLCCVNSILTTSKSWIRFHFAGSTLYICSILVFGICW